MQHSLQVLNIVKYYQTPSQVVEVLNGVSFNLKEGESLAITGPSGSGKSTLLHILGTLEPPNEGHIVINGKDPFRLNETDLARFRNHTVGFVFQDHYLLPQYSLLENVLIPTVAFRDDPSDKRPRANMLLERVGLRHRLSHLPAALSGGERQRAAIARALINAPPLLLCDEPTGNLDQETADKVADLLFELHREAMTMLIVVTHNEKLACRFQRRFAVEKGIFVEH